MADRRWRLLLPKPVRRLPADIAAVFGFVLLTNLAVLAPVVRETPLRVVLGLPFVLFVPGYAFIAALFPEAGEAPTTDDESSSGSDGTSVTGDRGIDGIERVALSFGLSIAVVPLIGLVLNFTPWGIRLVPIMVAVSGFTIVCGAVAARRRWQLPPEERFGVPYREWLTAGRSELLEPTSRADAALNVLLVASIILAVASVGYAVAVPKQGETFTEFYILTENETGDLVADDYPTEFERGERKPVVVGVGNQEHETVSYSVVVQLERVNVTRVGNNTTATVLEREELDRLQTGALEHNETWHQEYGIEPTMTGDRLRVAFLLYRDAPPAQPTVDNAYRELHLWVNVSERGTESTSIRAPGDGALTPPLRPVA
jgi:uncharacterized membrane protein